MLVAEIARRAVGGARTVDEPRRRLALRRAFGAGERAEVVVEGVILFDDDDDVLDRDRAGLRRVASAGRAVGSSASVSSAIWAPGSIGGAAVRVGKGRRGLGAATARERSRADRGKGQKSRQARN